MLTKSLITPSFRFQSASGEIGAGECSASGMGEEVTSPDDGASSSPGAKPDAEAIFRELEGLTSMMDSVTQSLISARDGGSHDVGGGGEEAASIHLGECMNLCC